jgi:hypothetical protein
MLYLYKTASRTIRPHGHFLQPFSQVIICLSHGISSTVQTVRIDVEHLVVSKALYHIASRIQISTWLLAFSSPIPCIYLGMPTMSGSFGFPQRLLYTVAQVYSHIGCCSWSCTSIVQRGYASNELKHCLEGPTSARACAATANILSSRGDI